MYFYLGRGNTRECTACSNITTVSYFLCRVVLFPWVFVVWLRPDHVAVQPAHAARDRSVGCRLSAQRDLVLQVAEKDGAFCARAPGQADEQRSIHDLRLDRDLAHSAWTTANDTATTTVKTRTIMPRTITVTITTIARSTTKFATTIMTHFSRTRHTVIRRPTSTRMQTSWTSLPTLRNMSADACPLQPAESLATAEFATKMVYLLISNKLCGSKCFAQIHCTNTKSVFSSSRTGQRQRARVKVPVPVKHSRIGGEVPRFVFGEARAALVRSSSTGDTATLVSTGKTDKDD